MIIDMHTHTFPEKLAAGTLDKLSHMSHTVPFSDGTTDGLLAKAGEAGIDLSVVLPVATAARQTAHINDASARLNEACAGRGIFSFGCMHPDVPDYQAELSRVASLGLKGIKVHPVYQDADLDDLRYLRIFARAAELNLIVVTHAGLDVGYPGVVRCSPQMARRVVREIGDFAFVLAHMGGWNNWEEVPEALADTGVFLDTAFSTERMTPLPDHRPHPWDLQMLDEEGFLRIFRAFGADRLLFGTDSPWSPQKESLAFIEGLPLLREEKDKILGGNAEKLLGLRTQERNCGKS